MSHSQFEKQWESYLAFFNRKQDGKPFENLCEFGEYLYQSTDKKTIALNLAIQVPAGGQVVVESKEMRAFYAFTTKTSSTRQFSISFLNDIQEPANATGYLVWRSSKAQKSEMDWILRGEIGWSRSPDFSGFDSSLITDDPYAETRKNNATGKGLLTMVGNLGSKAEAKVVLLYRQGNLGNNGDGHDVVMNQYQINYNLPNMRYRFGRYKVAAPGSGLAIQENGDAGEIQLKNFRIAHLVKRESIDGMPNDANQGDDVWIANYKLGNLRSTWLKTINITGLWGTNREDVFWVDDLSVVSEEDAEGIKHPIPANRITENRLPFAYSTYGMDLYWFRPQKLSGKDSGVSQGKQYNFSGTFSIYASERDARNARQPVYADADGVLYQDARVAEEGRGVVGLASVQLHFYSETGNAYVSSAKKNAISTVALVIAHGNGRGDGKFANGYLGETQGFEPNVLFAKGIIPALNKSGVAIGNGVQNKFYACLSYTWHGASPLEMLAETLNESVSSGSTRITLHAYQTDRAVKVNDDVMIDADTLLGYEAGFSTSVVITKGIRAQVVAGWLFREKGLKDVLTEDSWYASANLAIGL